MSDCLTLACFALRTKQLTMSTKNHDNIVYLAKWTTTFNDYLSTIEDKQKRCSEDLNEPNPEPGLVLATGLNKNGSIVKNSNGLSASREKSATPDNALNGENGNGSPKLTDQNIIFSANETPEKPPNVLYEEEPFQFSSNHTIQTESLRELSTEISQGQNLENIGAVSNCNSENLTVETQKIYTKRGRRRDEKIRVEETDPLPFTCAECNRRFKTYVQVVGHLRTPKMSNHLKRYFTWDPTLYDFKEINHVPSEMTKKLLIKKSFFPCGKCCIGFSRSIDWEAHLNETHPGKLQEYLICPKSTCQKVCSSWHGLKIHVKLHRRKKFKPSSCRKSFSSISRRNEHVLRVHTVTTFISEIETETADLNLNIKVETHDSILASEKEELECDVPYSADVLPSWPCTSDTDTTFENDFPTEVKIKDVEDYDVPIITSVTTEGSQHPEEPEIRVTCNGCSNQFSNLNALKSHLTLYLSPLCRERTFTWNPDCDEKFQNLSSENSETARNICMDCRLGFLREFKLKAHLLYIHGLGQNEKTIEEEETHEIQTDELSPLSTKLTEKPVEPMPKKSSNFSCALCDLTFSSRKKMKSHKRSRHAHKGPHKCKECGLEFPLLVEMENHTRLHSGRELHTCEICNTSFLHPGSLRTHRHKVHGLESEPYRCEVCEKPFLKLCNLKSHRESHREKPPILCEICGEDFTNRRQLNFHMKIHSPWRPEFNCEQCDRRFDHRSQLAVHMDKIHKEKKSFVCEECKRIFTTQSGLNKHMMNDHPQDGHGGASDERQYFHTPTFTYLSSIESVEIKPESMYEEEFIEDADDYQDFQFEFISQQ